MRLCRYRLRLTALIAALVIALLAFTTGIAGADDAPPPDPNPTTTTTAPPNSDPAPTTSPSSPTAAPADAPNETPTTTTSSTTQDANVDNHGTAAANTGANQAQNQTTTSPATGGTDTSGGSSSTTTGQATATGSATTDSIQQVAQAIVTDAGKVVISQIALIVNIGFALANSGANRSDAGTAVVPGASLVDTGSAGAVGLSSSTAVTQVVRLLDGDPDGQQTATVTNVGLALANSGANASAGEMSTIGPGGTAVAVTWGPSSAVVAAGSAAASGDTSHTTIIQIAIGTATDDGTLQITQRAVVVNFGAALANSGINAAGGADQESMIVRGLVLALLSALMPGPSSTVSVAGGAQGVLVSTGAAIAIGNDSRTAIRQLAQGTVSGSESASSDQAAMVSNFGIGIANTGLNAAGAGTTSPDVIALSANDFDAVTGLFGKFLQMLSSANQQGEWSAQLALGAELLAATGDIGVVETVLGIPGVGDAATQVMIRQVTAILNLSFALATTGENHATATGAHTAMAGGSSRAHGDSTSVRTDAVIHTGDALALNRFVTMVCQVINAPMSECSPPPVDDPSGGEPTTPAPGVEAPRAVEVAGVAATPAAAGGGALAFTGSTLLPVEIGTGLALIVLGAMLLTIRRRRATAGSPHHAR